MKLRSRLLLANLHTTSRPAIVVPWLMAQCYLRRVDAVLLQECTDRHARALRRLPRWQLVRQGDEALLGRRRLLDDTGVLTDVSTSWRGHHTGRDHKRRTLPHARLRGWLRIASVHLPPGWEAGPQDRRHAGQVYLNRVERFVAYTEGPTFLGGDWNALRLSKPLRAVWRRLGMRAHGRGIDYAAERGARIVRWKRIGRAPGMDHRAVLVIAVPDVTEVTRTKS